MELAERDTTATMDCAVPLRLPLPGTLSIPSFPSLTLPLFRCLDGSPAVGACIPSCTGDMCGGVTVTYSCGSGYTCTTGNICCQTSACPLGGTPIGPPVNGLCPGGYTLQGNQCCSTTGTCPAGSTLVGPVSYLDHNFCSNWGIFCYSGAAL